jgi:hypothetical protein
VALLTGATVGSEEVHVTDVVRSLVVPSEKVPVAVSGLLVLLAIDESAGVTVIEVSTAAVTVTVVFPDTAA